MFDMRSVGRRLAYYRKERNLTQMELAEMLQVSGQAISNWERGVTMPDISKLPALSRILKMSIDIILSDDADNDRE